MSCEPGKLRVIILKRREITANCSSRARCVAELLGGFSVLAVAQAAQLSAART